jgi:hypothetical protein
MAAEAVWARMAPPSPTSLLPTPSRGTSRLKPAAFFASWRQPVSLVHPTWSGHADAARIKRLRGKASTSAEVLSPVVYNCRIIQAVASTAEEATTVVMQTLRRPGGLDVLVCMLY